MSFRDKKRFGFKKSLYIKSVSFFYGTVVPFSIKGRCVLRRFSMKWIRFFKKLLRIQKIFGSKAFHFQKVSCRFVSISCGGRAKRGAREGGTHVMHGRCRMTIDHRIPTTPGRSTSGFHRPGRQCLQKSAKRREVCGELQGGGEKEGGGRLVDRAANNSICNRYEVKHRVQQLALSFFRALSFRDRVLLLLVRAEKKRQLFSASEAGCPTQTKTK